MKVQNGNYNDIIYDVDITCQNTIICNVDSKKFETVTGYKIEKIVIDNEF